MENSVQNPRFWLLTSPRTASNLFVRMLNLEQQNVRTAWNGGYFFMPSLPARMKLLSKPQKEWTNEETKSLHDQEQQCFDTLQDHLAAADENGERVFVKEHIWFLTRPYYLTQYEFGPDSFRGEPTPLRARGVDNPTHSEFNLTGLPDEFMKTWRPTILIRHPAMQFPSLFRTAQSGIKLEGVGRPNQEPFKCEGTNKWLRAMYNFYAEHFGEDSQWPIIVDADDIMLQPELVTKYAALVGLDPCKVTFSWEAAKPEEIEKQNEAARRMLSTINESTQVNLSKVAGNVNIDEEAEKWKAEFGEEKGAKLEKWVRDAMPDYEYLRGKRLRLD
ncbi:hypothetical protein GGR56DRAFT_694835 [Xylariaceae sp. FL0804]|nr:hypothetical protein GGR56DRAFT_694835 [Xylariaceae sp. FL0804]